MYSVILAFSLLLLGGCSTVVEVATKTAEVWMDPSIPVGEPEDIPSRVALSMNATANVNPNVYNDNALADVEQPPADQEVDEQNAPQMTDQELAEPADADADPQVDSDLDAEPDQAAQPAVDSMFPDEDFYVEDVTYASMLFDTNRVFFQVDVDSETFFYAGEGVYATLLDVSPTDLSISQLAASSQPLIKPAEMVVGAESPAIADSPPEVLFDAAQTAAIDDASAPPPVAEPDPELAPEQNSDTPVEPEATPIAFKFIQLKDNSLFLQADFESLFNDLENALGTTYLKHDDYMLLPGEYKFIESFGVVEETRYVAVIAAYNDYANKAWKAIVKIKPTGKDYSILLHFDDEQVSMKKQEL